uniref:Secreted protein n=1 Tax=Loa loa TaxID=7209 RepID=A0A1I7VUM3_LOALO
MVTSNIVFALWAHYVIAKESRRRKYQPKAVDDIASGASAREKNITGLNGNRCFNMSSSKNDSTIMDASPLLKSNEEYAQVVSFPRLSSKKKGCNAYNTRAKISSKNLTERVCSIVEYTAIPKEQTSTKRVLKYYRTIGK